MKHASTQPTGRAAFSAATTHPRGRSGRTWRAVALAAPTILLAGSAWALDQSTGPNGARIDIVKMTRMYGLNGTGVRLGQSEGGEARATHSMLNGRVTSRGVGAVGDHASGVASIMMGAAWDPDGGGPHPTLRGVAHSAQLWGGGGNYYARTNWLLTNNVHIINMSAGFGPDGDGYSPQTLFIDSLIHANDFLFVKSAGNSGPAGRRITIPGDNYNGVTVGALGASQRGTRLQFISQDYTKVANYSSRGTTGEADDENRRHKPDIVAPGSLIMMAGGDSNTDLQDPNLNPPLSQYQTSGTSFAAPHVSGVAALLRQRAAVYDAPQGHDWRFDHRVLKATILNAASKHVRDPHTFSADHPQGIPWPLSAAASNSLMPADTAMGVGALSGMATIRQYNPYDAQLGVHSNVVDANDSDAQTFNRMVRGSLVTATLAWDRDITLDDPDNPGQYGSYTVRPLADLDLRLIRVADGSVVAESNSVNDSIEHIYYNVQADGIYRLEVRNGSNDFVRYGLAYSAGSSAGPAFSVRDNGAHRAEGLLSAGFENGHAYPNDVNALGAAGPGNFRIGGEIFVAGSALYAGNLGTNQQRLSGALGTRSRVGPHNGPPAAMSVLDPANQTGVFGLTNGDEITGISWGTDGSRRTDGGVEDPSILFFSVDPDAVGMPNTAVVEQASSTPQMGGLIQSLFPRNPGGGDPGNEAAGDIFKTRQLTKFGWYASVQDSPANLLNDLEIDEEAFGLQAPAGRGSLFQDNREDDVDAFEFDDPVLHPRGVDTDGDGMHEKPVFFTLSPDSASLLPGIWDAGDIFASLPHDPSGGFDSEPDAAGFGFHEYADFSLLGLTQLDAIDALIVSDVGPGGMPDGFAGGFGNQPDEVLFSLMPGSVSGGPGDIFYSALDGSFQLFASAGAIGLDANDNLNALDIRRFIPAPATISLLAPAALLMRRRRSTCLS